VRAGSDDRSLRDGTAPTLQMSAARCGRSDSPRRSGPWWRSARARGRAPARYVREVTLGAVPKVSRTRANAPIIRELGALALALQCVNRVLKQPGEGEASDPRRDGETGRAAAQTSATEDIDAAVGGLLVIVRRLG
jgi:hypothetical protein